MKTQMKLTPAMAGFSTITIYRTTTTLASQSFSRFSCCGCSRIVVIASPPPGCSNNVIPYILEGGLEAVELDAFRLLLLSLL